MSTRSASDGGDRLTASADWPTFTIDYRVIVKAKDKEAARSAFFHVVCSGDAIGPDWELVEEEGFRRIAKKQELYDQGTYDEETSFGTMTDNTFTNVGVYDQEDEPWSE
jgi:hypothetical protein